MNRLLLSSMIAVTLVASASQEYSVETSSSVESVSFDVTDPDPFGFEQYMTRIHDTWSEAWDSNDELADARAEENGRIRLAEDRSVVAGVCRRYEGRRTVFSCVPLQSPTGGTAIRAEEDGSARYTDGWALDGSSGVFYRP